MKNKIEITVYGSTQSEKSIVAAVIANALKELGANVLREDEAERNLGNPNKPSDWELEKVKDSWITIKEINIPHHQ